MAMLLFWTVWRTPYHSKAKFPFTRCLWLLANSTGMRRVCHFLFCSVHFGGNVEPDSSGNITKATDRSPRLVCLTSASCWLHNSRKQLCFRPLPNVEDSANLEAFAEGAEHTAKYSASMTSMECFFVCFFGVYRSQPADTSRGGRRSWPDVLTLYFWGK